LKVILVVGARPNFMKVGPVYFALKDNSLFTPYLVHTGQHYDVNLSKVFFDHLGFPKPDRYLGVGSGTHGVQTAKIMIQFEKVLFEEKPDAVLVAGDVNSTIACALDAVKMHIPVAHLEAGLRSFDRKMPEEINRILTDSISQILLTPSPNGNENLMNEGISPEKIYFVGNAMIDSLKKHEKEAENSNIINKLNLEKDGFGLITLHRPSNVDKVENFKKIIKAFSHIQKSLPLIFPIHPRTVKMIKKFSLQDEFDKMKNFQFVEPLGYFDFLKLEKYAKVVLTDSGGIQEETTVLNVPCLTIRDNTERPITITQGTNKLVGTDTEKIIAETDKILRGNNKKGQIPDKWDGNTAQRVVKVFKEYLKKSG